MCTAAETTHSVICSGTFFVITLVAATTCCPLAASAQPTFIRISSAMVSVCWHSSVLFRPRTGRLGFAFAADVL